MNINQILPILSVSKITNDVVLMRGLHGIGKSDIVKQYTKANNLHLEVLILSLMESGDLLGIPNIVDGRTDWAEPDWIQKLHESAWPSVFSLDDLEFTDTNFEMLVRADKRDMNKKVLEELYKKHYKIPNATNALTSNQRNVQCKTSKETVLFVDEYSRSTPDVHNATMQLILDKRLHNHILPFVKGTQTQIIAADNPANGDYHVTELDPAKLDRFLITDVEVDPKSWLSWARDNGVNAIVRDFIMNNTTKLHFTPKDQSETGATPRSWTKLGEFVDQFDNLPEESIFPIIRGKIGSSLGAQFYTFYNEYNVNISIKDIEKEIKKLERKHTKSGLNYEESLPLIGESIKKMMQDMEGVTKMEYSEEFFNNSKKAITEGKDTKSVIVLLGMLYSLELELLTSLLKEWKNNEKELFYALVKLDPKKALALRIRNKITA